MDDETAEKTYKNFLMVLDEYDAVINNPNVTQEQLTIASAIASQSVLEVCSYDKVVNKFTYEDSNRAFNVIRNVWLI